MQKNDHYYTETPVSESRPAEARFSYRGHEMTLLSDAGVFSRGEVDAGTRILLNALPKKLTGDILDLGCGWGPIGICIALENPDCSLTFADINNRALELARQNSKRYGISGKWVHSDGFSDLKGAFDCIVTNPPIRAGKQTIYQMFADSAAHLKPEGRLYLVIRKQQGAPSAIKFLSTVFTDVTVIEKSGGYWVIRCVKEGFR